MNTSGKKSFWLLGMLALLTACQANRDTPARAKLLWISSGTKHVQPLWNIDHSPLCSDLAEMYACAQRIEAHYTTLYPQQCARSDHRLTIHLHTGQSLHYDNTETTDSQETTRYNLLAYFPEHQFYLILKTSSATREITLVDALNGNAVEIPHIPLFSPDNARFVAASNRKGHNNRIEVWTISSPAPTQESTQTVPAKRLVREWAGESDTWRFSGIEWIGPESFSLTRRQSANVTDVVGETMHMIHIDKDWVGHLMGAN